MEMNAKLLICIPCRDRKAIVEQCVPTVADTIGEKDCVLLCNDGSSEYDWAWLRQFTRNCLGPISSERLGIEEQRRSHFKYFVGSKEGFTHLYLCDSDALHDPLWRSAALSLQAEHGNLPLCLYNTAVHANMPNNTIEDDPKSDVIWRKFAPGISYLLTADHVKKVMDQIHYVKSWDWDVPRILGYRFAVSRVSYVDHIGYGGVHSDKSHGYNDGDRATSPTSWLVEKRKEVVAALSKEASWSASQSL